MTGRRRTGLSLQTLHPTRFDEEIVLYQTPPLGLDWTFRAPTRSLTKSSRVPELWVSSLAPKPPASCVPALPLPESVEDELEGRIQHLELQVQERDREIQTLNESLNDHIDRGSWSEQERKVTLKGYFGDK
ncbi:hypothetical protein CLAIMM_15112 [Cladophialophora immunda]|nr:hypothetical protein CLAIMM_15112 [Cladophialophora immunda]